MPTIIVILIWLILLPSQSLHANVSTDIQQAENYIISFKTPALSQLSEKSADFQQRFTQQTYAITQEHNNLLEQLKARYSKTYKPLFEYHHALNAICLSLTVDEVSFIRQDRNIMRISKEEILFPASDASASMINADQLWNGQAIEPLAGVQGEQVIIGVLDTGINFTHEAFSDTPEDAYDFGANNPFGADTFIGWCDPSHPNHDASFICNNKLIGAWDFIDELGNEADGPIDNNFHGTSMSAISAGNSITAPEGGFVFSFNGGVLDAPFISGIAPHSHIIMYDVCDSDIACPSSAILAAIEQAIIDGVDIINLALDGGSDPWNPNSVAFALLNASNQGIITSSAAGNATSEQPSIFGRVNNLAPWLLTAANSFHGRTQSNTVSVIDPLPVPDFLLNIYALITDGVAFMNDLSAEIRYSAHIDINNTDGCQAWLNDVFNNSIALIPDQTCETALKIQNAEDAGAIAVVIFSSDSDLPSSLTGITSPMIPAVMIGKSDADNIIAQINAVQPTPIFAEIMAETTHTIVDELGLVLYHSSLIGPNDQFNISKPDISAPGTNIFSAIAELGQPAPQYFTLTGTSQSAAVVSGALALFKSIHPDWSPSEIKSALMLTANDDMTDEEANDVTSDDIGSGMLDISKAVNSALAMDESITNYVAADPNDNGLEQSLNLPSLRNNHCPFNCAWQRTLTNKSDATHQWSVSFLTDNDSQILITPNQFTLAPDESITLDIQFISTNTTINERRFAKLFITDDNAQTPTAQLMITVYLDDLIFADGFE